MLLLITNHLRKDLTSSNEYEVSLSLQCLSKIANVDLARDLTPEIFTLLSSSRINVRKMAIGVVLRVFDKYPDAVRVCFKRLVENLENSDPQIVSAVISVFCELASKDPRSYLPLAPEFYKILVDSRNNWVLIKVLKIFAQLATLEPRLAKRLVEPICDHMRRTVAKSLLFECVRTIVTSLSDYESAMKLAVAKIREFLLEDDPNLKYLGLQALSIVAQKHSWAVLENKDIVIKSLSDVDPNIKVESLRLVMEMVSESNVAEISRVLLNYALKSDPEFCNKILGSILSTCSRNVYEIIVDFDWYASFLGEMSRIPHCQMGGEIENQIIDIGMRVQDVRPQLVHVARDLLIDPALLGNPFLHRILSAAAWVSGEYVEFTRNPFELLEAQLQPRTSLLPPSIQAIYIQSTFKVLTFCVHTYLLQRESSDNLPSEASGSGLYESLADLSMANGSSEMSPSSSLEKNNFSYESILNMLNVVELAFNPLSGSHDVEIKERAHNVLGFIDLLKENIVSLQKGNGSAEKEVEVGEIVQLVHEAFSEELGPVSASAQERVPLPDGLILKENLVDLEAICGDIGLLSSNSFSFGDNSYEERTDISLSNLDIGESSEKPSESTSLLAEHRKRHGLYYLPSEKSETIPNDYPRANDPMSQDNATDEASDLIKLAEQSFVPRRKPSHAKPRPVVVRLDDGDIIPIATKKSDPKDVSLSDAVRDALLGTEAIANTSSQSNLSDKPPSKRKGKEKLNRDLNTVSKDNLVDDVNSSSRRSRHRSHGKEKREDNGRKEKRKSSHRRGKNQQVADESLSVAVQKQEIPDFLL